MSLIEYKGIVGLAIDQTCVDENQLEDTFITKGSILNNLITKIYH